MLLLCQDSQSRGEGGDPEPLLEPQDDSVQFSGSLGLSSVLRFSVGVFSVVLCPLLWVLFLSGSPSLNQLTLGQGLGQELGRADPSNAGGAQLLAGFGPESRTCLCPKLSIFLEGLNVSRSVAEAGV